MSTHRFDWQGLAWGGLALAVVGHWLARELGLVDTGDLALLLPLVLIVAGVVGVAVSVLRPRRPARPAHQSVHPAAPTQEELP